MWCVAPYRPLMGYASPPNQHLKMMTSPLNRAFVGVLPSSICPEDGSSPLDNLRLGNNQLTGSVDITRCRKLFLLDLAVSNKGRSVVGLSAMSSQALYVMTLVLEILALFLLLRTI